jgi:hypothetical protein
MKQTDQPRTATEAQIKANRQNAKKSTGPTSAQGKAASSRNGLTHGLSANKHILLDEDPEEFLLLLKDLYDRFRPVGLAEEKLVQRIANDQWRLDRAIPMEAGIYRQRLEAVAADDYFRKQERVNHRRNHQLRPEFVPPPPAPPDAGDRLTRAFISDCSGSNLLAKLTRHEAALQRSLDRGLRQLKAFQAAREVPVASPKLPILLKPNRKPPQTPPPRPPHKWITKRTQKMGVSCRLRLSPKRPPPTDRSTHRGNSAKITASRRHEPRTSSDEL